MIIYILFLKCTLMCDVHSSDHKAHFAKKRDENAFSTDSQKEGGALGVGEPTAMAAMTL